MVSPVSNGLPQQIPAANTFQPAGTAENIREKDRTEQAAASGVSTENRATESRRTEERTTVSASSRDEDNGQTRARTDRGSVFDVTV